jgi:hypothetical protein
MKPIKIVDGGGRMRRVMEGENLIKHIRDFIPFLKKLIYTHTQKEEVNGEEAEMVTRAGCHEDGPVLVQKAELVP